MGVLALGAPLFWGLCLWPCWKLPKNLEPVSSLRKIQNDCGGSGRIQACPCGVLGSGCSSLGAVGITPFQQPSGPEPNLTFLAAVV